MNLPAKSADYEYVRFGYPSNLDKKCILCQLPVEFSYSNSGKLIHCLEQDIYQVIDLFICTNEKCLYSKKNFNPTPRFDYGARYYGADVFRFVANEFLPPLKQKPSQIHTRIRLKHPNLDISEQTITRMCDDILKIKAFSIDRNTIEMIQNQGFILLGFDGQDPGGNAPALWSFMELTTNRILSTTKFETLNYQILHEYLVALQAFYGVPIIGWVTDKQNVIVKCHDTYYKDIPHQYCQFHFQTHLWDHIQVVDSQIFMPLKKLINKLYIHTADTSKEVKFDYIGKRSVREIFKPMDDDFQSMIRARNKKFKELRGLWLYETLGEYIKKGRKSMDEVDPEFRVAIILKRIYDNLSKALDAVKPWYDETLQLSLWFQQIRGIFNDIKSAWQEKQRQIDCVFKEVYENICSNDSQFQLEDCKSFLPGKIKEPLRIKGEWCRLWNSYLSGLFKYEQFLGHFRTNGENERAFSKQKQMLITRAGKGIVCHIIATRGEDYLRLTHCSEEELKTDIIEESSQALIYELRTELRAEISNQAKSWRTRDKAYEGYDGVKNRIPTF
ncbi:hypothetical protein NEF87_004301 [Candidatus Lokiarchaeum ossiferum]|uniref:MULE transposase domain-containing protein n=1 Tax=Candidatus Lokiarchaeum ossiferum TaxID=2951803 RepID=A0ABY6HZK4_9ARCH|nr:hypothetical protein NEF87_004301 [Candidatus Lokiarchaeum sp. B-35]